MITDQIGLHSILLPLLTSISMLTAMHFFVLSDNRYIFFWGEWNDNLVFFVRFWLLGYKGNLAERTMALVFSVVLGIPVLFIELFILLWQTYVLVVNLHQKFGVVFKSQGGGGTPIYKGWVHMSEILKRTPRGTKVLFCGRGLKFFSRSSELARGAFHSRKNFGCNFRKFLVSYLSSSGSSGK